MLHQVDNSYEKTWNGIHLWKISMCTYVKKLKHISQIEEYECIHVITMSYEKEGRVLFVIQYQCNVSLSSLLQSVNTNF